MPHTQRQLLVRLIALGSVVFLAGGSFRSVADDSPDFRPIAHAHNDYYHPRPLLDALDHGFTSVEADVFPVDDELLVGHSERELDRNKTLERLYLRPLQELVNKNGGRVIPGGPTVILLVDIKRAGAVAWDLLQRQLQPHRAWISETRDGLFIERAVTVVVSGDRAADRIAAANPRFAGMDGRLSDLDRDDPVSRIPLISDNWSSHFRYRGQGKMPAAELERLREMVQKAHSKGRRLRFWATPESESLWQELRTARVDLIGTDDLLKLQTFLAK